LVWPILKTLFLPIHLPLFGEFTIGVDHPAVQDPHEIGPQRGSVFGAMSIGADGPAIEHLFPEALNHVFDIVWAEQAAASEAAEKGIISGHQFPKAFIFP